jgi:hypothetical protein
VDTSENAAIIAATGSNGSLTFFYAVYGTGRWNAEPVAPADYASSAPSLTPDGSYVDMSVMGPDGNALFSYSAFGSDNWYLQTLGVPGEEP